VTLRNVAPTVELRPDDRPTGTEKHLGTGFPSGSRRLGPLTSLAAASEAACYLVTRSKNARLWSVLIDQFTGTVWKPLRSTKSFSL
jgi:hypothetical protein